MATSSEIQVTEAYIGLLGRAPDPAGLAYWAAELDAAVAAGEDPAVALKKLTNDITLNDEWLVDGDGALDVTGGTDAQNLANAETVVGNMYTRLFDRVADDDEIDYWAPKIVSGEFTSAEMAVALIQGAGTTDAGTLGFKQEAATYYVETVDQDDFSRQTAQASVEDVNSPLTLKDSKDNTDVLVSGEGVTATLNTSANTIAMTYGDDTVTGTVGTGATFNVGDSLLDTNTKDNDTLTLTGDSGFNFGATSNIENINVSLSERENTRFTIDADNDTGGSTINLTVAESVVVAGTTLDGETRVTLNNLASDVSTTNVTEMVVTLDTGADQTLTFDGDLATLDLSAVDANGTTVTFANNDVTFAVSGTAATNDAMSVSVDNEVTITHGAQDVELLTISGSDNDAAVTIAGVAAEDKMVYTVAGDNDVTLIGNVDQFSGSGFSNAGSGDVALQLSGASGADSSIENFGVLGGGVSLTAAAADYDVISLASGNTVTVAAAGANVAFDANDTATDSSITINANTSTAALDTVGFETVTIDTNDSSAIDLGAVSFNDATVTVGGTNDVTINTVDAVDSLSVAGDDVVLDGAVTNTNDLTLTGTNDADSVAVTANNDVTFTAGDESSVTGTVTITAGDLTITAGDSVDVDAIDVAAGDITLTATENEIDMSAAVDTDAGSLVVNAGTSVAAGGAIGANDVSITGGTTVTLAAAADITAQNDVTITSGSTAGNDVTSNADITVTAGNVAISGDDIDLQAGAVAVNAGNVTLTANNDITDVSATVTASAGDLTISAGATGNVANVGAALEANDVTITAGEAITIGGGGDITADNDVTITAGTGADCDVTTAGDITVTAGNVAISGDAVNATAGAIAVTAGNVEVTATNDVVDLGGSIAATAGDVTITAGTEITALSGTLDGNDVTVSADESITISGAITSDNDVTISTVAGDGNDVALSGAITANVGNVAITGDALDLDGGAVTVTSGNVTITTYNEVTDIDDDITTDAGKITINAGTSIADLAVNGDLEANEVELSATTTLAWAGAITSENDVTISTAAGDGNDVALSGAITANVGNVAITGDALDLDGGAVSVTSGNVTITTYNEVTDIDDNITTDAGKITISAGTSIGDLAAAGDLEANEVELSATTTLTWAGAITSENDVTISTDTGAGNDVSITGAITVNVGDVSISGDDITYDTGGGQLDVAKGSVVIDAANDVVIDDEIDTDYGAITIEAGGTLDLDEAIVATNDITVTTTGDMDVDGNITTSLGDIEVTGNEVDALAITATAGAVSLSATSDVRTKTSTIGAVTAGGGDITLSNGQWDTGAIDASGDLVISGDTIATMDSVVADGVLITTDNDVTIEGELNTGFVVSTGSNDIDLGTVVYDAGNDAVSITTGAGNDTMVLDDDLGGGSVLSVFEVSTGAGIDTVTVADDGIAASSIINLGAGDDVLVVLDQGNDSSYLMGADDDTATPDELFAGTINGEGGDDTIILTGNDDFSGGSGDWVNIEYIQIDRAVTLSADQLQNDTTFQLTSDDGITSATITATGITGVDLSNVTFETGWDVANGFDLTATTGGVSMTGSDASDTLTGNTGDDTLSGGGSNDTIDGGAGADTMTGGSGVDTFFIGGNDSSSTDIDVITDFTSTATLATTDVLEFDTASTDGIVADEAAFDVSAAVTGTGTVSAATTNGVITLSGANADDVDTLAEWLGVAELVVAQAMDADDIVVIAFEFDGDTYVAEYEHDDDGDTDLINLVKLTGVTDIDTIATTAGATTITIG